MEQITLYEELRLIERNESEINAIWKGAHLLLFFLAFVFGSFCTFCFHILMYLFDEKCVLFPRLLIVTTFRQNFIYEYIPDDKDKKNVLPVDFINTQWVDKSACYLPTYVPLVSGIFGLVWTTIYLMCSTGSRVLTGLQKPWRVLPPAFVFSLAMGCLCVYTSSVTHYGLQDFCRKLGEVTGSTTCTFTVNVATLAYQRRIRGVYQAIHLTIISAWLHTSCWLLSVLITIARVVLAVDFQLVRITAQLQGNIDRMLEQHERQVFSILPPSPSPEVYLHSGYKVHFKRKTNTQTTNEDGEIIYFSDFGPPTSNLSLVSAEYRKRERMISINALPKEHRFILKMIYDLLDTIDLPPDSDFYQLSSSSSDTPPCDSITAIKRQFGQQRIVSHSKQKTESKAKEVLLDKEEAEKMARDLKKRLQKRMDRKKIDDDDSSSLTTYTGPSKPRFESTMAFEEPIKTIETVEDNAQPLPSTSKSVDTSLKSKKSSLKHVGVQTKSKGKVHIESRTDFFDTDTSDEEIVTKDKETQTKKEKQD